MKGVSSWTRNAALKWSALFVLLVLAVGVVLELEIRSADVQASGTPAVEVAGGHKLLIVIVDSLAPEDAEAMDSFQRLAANSWTAPIEPCLERMTKMCIEETVTGRTAFSLFGFLRNLGPVSGGVGPNLLADARAVGRRVAMVSRGDLKLLKASADEHVVFKEMRLKREINKVLALTQTNDIVLYHYAWHDLASHKHKMGTRPYKRSVQHMDKALGRIVDGLGADIDLMVLGDHGHTSDGRHLQGLDTPTVLALRSDRVQNMALEERIHITAARFLAGLVTGLHSPDSAWPAEWAAWAPPEVASTLPAATQQGSNAGGLGRSWGALVPLGLMLVFLARIGGVIPALAVGLIGLGMGLGWEMFMDRVHYAHGIPRVHHVSYWILIIGGVLGLVFARKLRGVWSGVVIATGVTCLLLYPLIYHYGVFRNARHLAVGLVVVPAALWFLRRRSPWAILAGIYGYFIWVDLTWIKVTNLEVLKYRSFDWMTSEPDEGRILIAVLAFACYLAIDRGRWWSRFGLAVLAPALVLAPIPNGLRMVAFIAIFAMPWVPHHLRARLLALCTFFALPMLFGPVHQAGVMATVFAVWALFVSVQGAMAANNPGRTWAWGAGIGLAIAAHVSLGWTFGLNVMGIDFGFTLEFLPGDLHERLWWLIGIATFMKIMLPIVLMIVIAREVFGPKAQAIVDICTYAVMLRATTVMGAAIAWMFAPETNAGGTLFASVLQDGFFWALIGVVVPGTWWALERDRPPGFREA